MRRLLHLSLSYASAAAIHRLAAAAVTIWIARELAVDAYGRFGLLYAMQQGVITLALGGLTESVVGAMKGCTSEVALDGLFRAAWGALTIGLVLAVIPWIAYGYLADGSHASAAEYACVLVSGSILVIATFKSHIERLQERHARALLTGFVPGTAGLLAGGAAALATRSIVWFFVGSIIGSAVAILLLRFGSARAVGSAEIAQEVTVAASWRLFVASLPFLVAALVGWLNGYGNTYVIQFILGSTEVAYYTAALAFASLLLMVTTALNQVWTPRFFALARSAAPAELERANCDFHTILAFALGAAGGFLVLCMPLLAQLVGKNFSGYDVLGAELALMFWGYVMLTPWWQCANYLLVHGMGMTMLKITLLSSAVGIAVWIALMATMGRLGIYLGFGAMMVLRSAIMLRAARRRWPIALEWRGKLAGTALLVLAYALHSPSLSQAALALAVFAVACWLVYWTLLRATLATVLTWRQS